jgi:hypothetical protein
MTDARAIKLLNKACWSAQGWKDELDLLPDELEYLESSGYARPQRQLTHDECVTWAIESLGRVSRERVCDAFVASLTSRRLEYRSALGSYAYLHLMPAHAFVGAARYRNHHCATCGLDPKITLSQRDFIALSFERHKWGGVRHDDLSFMAFDLEMFARLPPVSPAKEDWQALRSILDSAADPETGRSVTTLRRAIKKCIKSNDAEADTLCHILSYAGILATDKHRGFDEQFTPFAERADLRPGGDQRYPLNCWFGPGYRADAVRFWFPQIAAG